VEHFRAAAIPLVLSFIDRINRNDLDGIAELLADDKNSACSTHRPKLDASAESTVGAAIARPIHAT
jgi:hypothetical protein